MVTVSSTNTASVQYDPKDLVYAYGGAITADENGKVYFAMIPKKLSQACVSG